MALDMEQLRGGGVQRRPAVFVQCNPLLEHRPLSRENGPAELGRHQYAGVPRHDPSVGRRVGPPTPHPSGRQDLRRIILGAMDWCRDAGSLDRVRLTPAARAGSPRAEAWVTQPAAPARATDRWASQASAAPPGWSD